MDYRPGLDTVVPVQRAAAARFDPFQRILGTGEVRLGRVSEQRIPAARTTVAWPFGRLTRLLHAVQRPVRLVPRQAQQVRAARHQFSHAQHRRVIVVRVRERAAVRRPIVCETFSHCRGGGFIFLYFFDGKRSPDSVGIRVSHQISSRYAMDSRDAVVIAFGSKGPGYRIDKRGFVVRVML